jgi:hypothetical protein
MNSLLFRSARISKNSDLFDDQLAGPITYADQSILHLSQGNAGSLDFNFNPGPLTTQAASLQILNFMSDGTLVGACRCGIGDVRGQLPAALGAKSPQRAATL